MNWFLSNHVFQKNFLRFITNVQVTLKMLIFFSYSGWMFTKKQSKSCNRIRSKIVEGEYYLWSNDILEINCFSGIEICQSCTLFFLETCQCPYLSSLFQYSKLTWLNVPLFLVLFCVFFHHLIVQRLFFFPFTHNRWKVSSRFIS